MEKEKENVEEKSKRVTISMTPTLIEIAKKGAKKENRSLSNYISYLVLKNDK